MMEKYLSAFLTVFDVFCGRVQWVS